MGGTNQGGEAALDLNLQRPGQDLVYGVDMCAPGWVGGWVWDNDPNTVQFNISVGRRIAGRSSTITLHF